MGEDTMKEKTIKEKRSNAYHTEMTGIERLLLNQKISKGLKKTYKKLKKEGKSYVNED